jgi:dolichol-phosphate mannosyltransferase
MNKLPLISIVTPCFNEEANVEELYRRVKAVISDCNKYEFEFIFIDNNSNDKTVEKLKALASSDPFVKVIVNTRNFGHIRSPYYGIMQSRGLATIYLASDLQDPPEMIPEFIREWEQGFKLVMATKPKSHSSPLMHSLRKRYYKLLDGISDISIVNDSTGFGLYDREVLDLLREINDPYPFLRGLVCELGFEIKTISFVQPKRLRGITKNNFYSLYDIAMLGIVSHSKIPIRIASFAGFLIASLSFLVALIYLGTKLLNWNSYPIGIAPALIGLFFLLGLQLIIIGVLGEYIASIHSYVQKRPIVVEKERINFDVNS